MSQVWAYTRTFPIRGEIDGVEQDLYPGLDISLDDDITRSKDNINFEEHWTITFNPSTGKCESHLKDNYSTGRNSGKHGDHIKETQAWKNWEDMVRKTDRRNPDNISVSYPTEEELDHFWIPLDEVFERDGNERYRGIGYTDGDHITQESTNVTSGVYSEPIDSQLNIQTVPNTLAGSSMKDDINAKSFGGSKRKGREDEGSSSKRGACWFSLFRRSTR
ncbi:uncharacterized protein L201_005283 [Kwoniella dendrophila CBS 6074]|uniref:Uncharacterized protein n=1 Tax=Kwoniella dendrophila CBS 6074 TaxID=1295534 RepID=A0AAX4K0P0_9TREE